MKKVSQTKMSDRIASIVMRYNLLAIGVLVVIEVLCVYIIPDKTLIAIISTATGGVISSLLTERITLIQYYFGASHVPDEKKENTEKQD